MNPDPLVDLEVAALHANVSIHTVYRWVRNGDLVPVNRNPSRVRLNDVSEVRDRMRANHRASLRAPRLASKVAL